ncbi:MAG: LPXTG cell wall anchor domain-containing protein [Vicinamibacterales bacterium]
MRHHVDVLGWVHSLWGGFLLLTGGALALLAVGAWFALAGDPGAPATGGQAVWVLAAAGALLVVAGGSLVAAGRALRRRSSPGRRAALGLAVPQLLVVPFGTALAIYTCWVLLNDDARREFGRPARAGRMML